MAPLLLLLPLRPIILTPYLPTYLKLWWLECAIKGIDSLFQFTSWVDAVIFVFSLENEASFNAIYNYYAKMCQYRNMQEIPLILVGTQGKYNNYDKSIFYIFFSFVKWLLSFFKFSFTYESTFDRMNIFLIKVGHLLSCCCRVFNIQNMNFLHCCIILKCFSVYQRTMQI